MNTRFITALGGYLNKLSVMFHRTAGPAQYGLYLDNNDGRFSFVAEPLVTKMNIAQNSAEVANAQTALGVSSTPATFIDASTLTLYTWNGTAWSTAVQTFGTVIKAGRMYFSPWNRRVYMSDKYCAIRRLKASS